MNMGIFKALDGMEMPIMPIISVLECHNHSTAKDLAKQCTFEKISHSHLTWAAMSTVYTSMAKGFPNEPAEAMIESSPPPPPPKRDDRNATPEVGMSSLGIHMLMRSLSPLSLLTPMLGLDIPLSPISPSSPSSAAEKTKKYSLLADLMESEKAYVELLTGIIRVRFAPDLVVPYPPSWLRTTESSCRLVTIKPPAAGTRRHVSQCGRGVQDESRSLGSEISISSQPDLIVSNSQ